MLQFLKRTSLYLLAVPLLFTALGIASNQSVLWSNGQTFPVLINDKMLAVMLEADEVKAMQQNNPDTWAKTMPATVMQNTIYLDTVHVRMQKDSHFKALADIFYFKGDGIYSIGDFSLMLGDWLWAFAPFVFGFDVVRKLSQREY
jgi:hypothetical protein